VTAKALSIVVECKGEAKMPNFPMFSKAKHFDGMYVGTLARKKIIRPIFNGL
jgi:hypothetical protein